MELYRQGRHEEASSTLNQCHVLRETVRALRQTHKSDQARDLFARARRAAGWQFNYGVSTMCVVRLFAPIKPRLVIVHRSCASGCAGDAGDARATLLKNRAACAAALERAAASTRAVEGVSVCVCVRERAICLRLAENTDSRGRVYGFLVGRAPVEDTRSETAPGGGRAWRRI